MGRYGDIDYSRTTKTGLGLGLALFPFGVIGAKVTFVANGGAIPGRERALFSDTEWLGIVLVLFSSIISGIVPLLTE